MLQPNLEGMLEFTLSKRKSEQYFRLENKLNSTERQQYGLWYSGREGMVSISARLSTCVAGARIGLIAAAALCVVGLAIDVTSVVYNSRQIHIYRKNQLEENGANKPNDHHPGTACKDPKP